MGCLIGMEGAELSVALRTTYLPGMIALDDVLAIKDLHYHHGVILSLVPVWLLIRVA